MTYSPHQLAYFAHKLTLRGPADSMDRMAGALLDAQVDLNPHQIDAALFATSNPLARGVILADEVGLGKTIEAGLLIAQRWAERRRRILIIVPANLRKQWHQELADKFPRFVDVLMEVRKRTTIAELNATTDIAKLYETWLRTREDWVEKKLKAAGILVDPGTKVIQ